MASSVTLLPVRKSDYSSTVTPLPFKQHARSRFRRSKGRHRVNNNNGKLPNSTSCGLLATSSDHDHSPVVLDSIVTSAGVVRTAEKMADKCGHRGLDVDADGDDDSERPRTCTSTMRRMMMSLFEPADNKLAMKLFGNRNALMKERRRQRATKNWVIHPCSDFRSARRCPF